MEHCKNSHTQIADIDVIILNTLAGPVNIAVHTDPLGNHSDETNQD